MLTSPTNEIPLPADIKKSYDNAKNAVTLAEAEVIRLRDLRISEEVTIVELNKQIVFANEQITKINAKLTFSEVELVTLTNQNASIAAEISLQRAQKEELANSLTERESACVAQESHLADRELALALRTATLEERTVLVEDRESRVKERENKIEEFVTTI